MRVIGQPLLRPQARRHLAGRGRFVSDMRLPGMLHAAFLRSPLAHGVIRDLDLAPAREVKGVVAVFGAADLNPLCTPWQNNLLHFPGMVSPSQTIFPDSEVVWAGQPLAIIIARSRAAAEDAAGLLWAEIEELPVISDLAQARAGAFGTASPGLESNLCFSHRFETGAPDQAFAEAAVVVRETFRTGRHTAVTLEPRAIIADFDPASRHLTVHHATQTPPQFHDIYARHFGLPDNQVRVIAPDIGGSFGMKLHLYHEEMAVVAASLKLGRPVKFVADRLESFLSDIHARDHEVTAAMAFDGGGRILGMEVEDNTLIGPFSAHPRSSVIEGNQTWRLMGSAYRLRDYRAALNVWFQNKVQTSQYRAVGHPIACMVTEGLIEKGARALGIDVLDLRARNLIPDDAYPATSATGYKFERLSHEACLARLKAEMRYDDLRAEQAALRARGVHRGIGFGIYAEITNPSVAFYGVGGVRVSSQDGAVLRLSAGGEVSCAISVTEQGQGTETVVAQVVAEVLGLGHEQIRVITGDTDQTPSGGAAWGCRGAGIGGEAARRGAEALKARILELGSAILQAQPGDLLLRQGALCDAQSLEPRLSFAEIGRIATYRADTLPAGVSSNLTVSEHFAPLGYPFGFTNGIHASLVEVDVETGLVKLLHHWVVEDCGRILNPLLVDEQIRGGVAQGIGAALFEECLYDAQGQLTNGSLADYLVPMACELPPISVCHIETPTADTGLGAKGAGEAGTAASGTAVFNAINDAIAPLGAGLAQIPVTPARLLSALEAAAGATGGNAPGFAGVS